MSNTLTVGELRRIIADLPDDMPVICDRCSDYTDQEPPEVIEVLRIDGRWVEYHTNQWEHSAERAVLDAIRRKGSASVADLPKPPGAPSAIVKVLHFQGN